MASPTPFEEGIEAIHVMKANLSVTTTETPEESEAVGKTLELFNLILDALKALDANMELINREITPDISYREYAADVIACRQFIPDEADFMQRKFPDYEFHPSQRVLKLLTYYPVARELLNHYLSSLSRGETGAKLGISKLLKKFNFLDALFGRKENVSDKNIFPRAAKQQFINLVLERIVPSSVDCEQYVKAIYVGENSVKKRLGRWVPSVEQGGEFREEVQLRGGEEEIELHVILGRLFITYCNQATIFNSRTVELLRLARLVLATTPEGELGEPLTKSQEEYLASFEALNEYVRSFIKINGLELQFNAALETQHEQLTQIFDLLFVDDNMIENEKLQEILDDFCEKTREYYDCQVRIRQALNLIASEYERMRDSGQDEEYEIHVFDNTQEEQDRIQDEISTQASELALAEKILAFKEHEFELFEANVPIEERNEQKVSYVATLDGQMAEQENIYKNKVLCGKALPKEFSISQKTSGVTSARPVKITMLIDKKVVKQEQVQLSQVTSVKSLGQSVLLGIDLSFDLGEPVSFYNLYKKLPTVSVKIQFGKSEGEFNMPMKIGEETSAYDVSTNEIEFTMGYYLSIKGGGYNPDAKNKRLQYEYDPNMSFQIRYENEQEHDEKKKEEQHSRFTAAKSARMYRGGNFVSFKEIIELHYGLNVAGTHEYDERDYVNLIEHTRGRQMHQIDERKQYKAATVVVEKERLRYAFEDVWKGPNDDPLFFNQYLAAMRELYQNLIQMQSTGVGQQLEILWTDRRWVNPFLPPKIFWRGRECYPVRLQMTSRGQELYQRYKEQLAGEGVDVSMDDDEVANVEQQEYDWAYDEQQAVAEPEERPVRPGLSHSPSIGVVLQLDSLFPVLDTDCSPNVRFFFGAKLTGGGMDSQSNYERAQPARKQVVKFEEVMRFEAPLPEVLDRTSGAVVGYDASDASLAEIPYAVKIIIYKEDRQADYTVQVGQCVIPLRTVFLLHEVKGEVAVNSRMSARLMVSFSPPRSPLVATPEIYFANVETTQYTGILPGDIDSVVSAVRSLPTRHGQINYKERDAIIELTEQEKNSYLTRYAQRTPYFKRGISLFCCNMQNSVQFYNDFIIEPNTAAALCNFLKITTLVDCVEFSVAIPFVPDTIARYYTEMAFGQFVEETRLTFDQVLVLSGGDYFEHACILQACAQACGYTAFVARVNTQTLCNEYFVLVIRDDEVNIIDPVTGRGYLARKEAHRDQAEPVVLETYVTGIIELFDSERLLINLQPELSPVFTNYDFDNPRLWARVQHRSAHADLEFRDYFYVDAQMQTATEHLNQLEEARRQEIVEVVKDFIKNYETRENKLTTFNDVVAEELMENNYSILDKYDVVSFSIDSAYEDSAALLEKVENSAIMENFDPLTQFVVYCKLKAFGLKFVHIRLDLLCIKPRHGSDRETGGKFVRNGNLFGLGW